MRDASFFTRPTDPQDHPGLEDALREIRDREAAGDLPGLGHAPETLTHAGRRIRETLHRAARDEAERV